MCFSSSHQTKISEYWMNEAINQDSAGVGAHWSSASLHRAFQAVLFQRQWACKTDGLSHAPWIHPHQHSPALSCATACCVAAGAGNCVCSCNCWRGQRRLRPLLLTWGLIIHDCTCSLGLCSIRVDANVQVLVLSLRDLLLLPSWLCYLCTCSHLCGWHNCPWGR